MNITFYNFTKRLNSTKVVTSTGTQATVVLKETSSLTHPNIRLQSASRPTYNYAYIGDFGRYYYVHEWTWRDGLWEVELEIDALASWKTSIGNFTTYVLRSSHSSDLYVRDSIYPGKSKFTVSKTSVTRPWNPYQGVYVFGVIADSGNASAVGGSTTYYVVTKSTFNNIIDDLIATIETDLSGVTDPDISLLAKTISNPLQWIKKCTWLPFTPPFGAAEPLYLGFWDTTHSVQPVTGEVTVDINHSITVALPDHPQISRGKWLNAAPYRRLQLNAGPFGAIEIPADVAQEATNLICHFYQDNITGDGTMLVTCGSWEMHYHAKIGVDVGLDQIYSNAHQFINATTDIAAGAAGAVQSGIKLNVSGAIDSAGRAANGIVDMAEAVQGTPTSTGADGSFAALQESWSLVATFMEIVDEDNARLGRPLCQIKTLSTIPGFIQVAEGDVDCEATLAEKATIKSYLEGGFYYE